MNTLLTKSALASAIALSIVACSPGGGGLAGIGGSGYVSSGSVSGFGSVFVNGVEFETDSATFDVDGESGTQDDLAIGMVVRVNGTIDDDGIHGTASSISFDEELQGPVTGPIVYDADGITGTFTILGLKVIIDSGSTTFDIDNDNVPPATIFGFDTIAVKNNVEVSGFFDTNGDIQATRIELKDIIFDTNSIVEIEGAISGLSGTTFNLGSLIVDASSATLDDLPNGLVGGQLVEAKGTLDAGYTTLTASKVEAEDNSPDDTDEFELEGIITDYIDDSNFKIDGITVDASSATSEPASITLADNLHIEVEGAIVNKVLIAKEIELEGGNFKVHAMVTAVPPVTIPNTFEVTPILGQPPITVTVTTGTQLEDDVSESDQFTLNTLNDTHFVEVHGFDDGNGGITATEVDIKEPSDVVVQGIIQSGATDGTVKVFDVEFTIEAPGQTKFEGVNDAPIDQSTFFSTVNLDTSVIKVQDDKTADGVANEIEIESP